MPLLKNNQDVKKSLKQQMYNWLVDQQKSLPKYLEEFIYSKFYDQYTPTDLYERQYRIISAITVSSIVETANGYMLSIYLDPNKVSYDPSIWGFHDSHGKIAWSYIPGDDPMTVFNNMAKGIHGYIGEPIPPQTPGRFWESFVDSVNHGGIYDIFNSFKKSLRKKGLPVK